MLRVLSCVFMNTHGHNIFLLGHAHTLLRRVSNRKKLKAVYQLFILALKHVDRKKRKKYSNCKCICKLFKSFFSFFLFYMRGK